MLRKSGRKHGEVYTKTEVVKYILDEVGYNSSRNLENIKILEPASGSGAFAKEIINRLHESSQTYGFDFLKSLNTNVVFVEKDNEAFQLLINNINTYITELGYSERNIDCVFNEDYLLYGEFPEFDCIVGNPPYIRNEYLDSGYKAKLKEIYLTFRYRADLYIPFFEKSLDRLKEKGKLSFICSNRWLYNQYGQLLRDRVAKEFHLEKLVNIEKTSPFDEEVIGYPCITTIANSEGKQTLYFETDLKEVFLNEISYRAVESPTCASWQNLFLDYNLDNSSLKNIEEQDFEIGIGVATGADKVFIKKKPELIRIEKSRLLPILKSNALKGDKIIWDESCIINPYEDGKLCDLEKYPNLKAYFIEHADVLKRRYVAKKNPKNWFKTIDKIKNDCNYSV